MNFFRYFKDQTREGATSVHRVAFDEALPFILALRDGRPVSDRTEISDAENDRFEAEARGEKFLYREVPFSEFWHALSEFDKAEATERGYFLVEVGAKDDEGNDLGPICCSLEDGEPIEEDVDVDADEEEVDEETPEEPTGDEQGDGTLPESVDTTEPEAGSDETGALEGAPVVDETADMTEAELEAATAPEAPAAE